MLRSEMRLTVENLFHIQLLIGVCLSTVTSVMSVDDTMWEHWKQKHRKVYNGPEEQNRRLIWEQNVAKVNQHNLEHDLGLVTYRMAINQFSDMTWDEFKRVYLSTKQKPSLSTRNTFEYQPLEFGKVPDSIDWREKGAVGPVKDQKLCGSCWAFSTTGSLEGQYALHQNRQVSLSEQQLIDCSSTYGNTGCHGGLMELAYEYVHDFWIEKEDDYPYLARNEECKHNESRAVLTVDGFYIVRSGKEQVLKHMVGTLGPVSVAIAADEGFHHYSSGIYTSSFCSQLPLNHGVLAVGYASEQGKDYWIVKNSWGADWGEHGYIRMARTGENMCGIASDASLPLISLYQNTA